MLCIVKSTYHAANREPRDWHDACNQTIQQGRTGIASCMARSDESIHNHIDVDNRLALPNNNSYLKQLDSVQQVQSPVAIALTDAPIHSLSEPQAANEPSNSATPLERLHESWAGHRTNHSIPWTQPDQTANSENRLAYVMALLREYRSLSA